MKSIFGLSPIKDEPYLTSVFSYTMNSDTNYTNYLLKNVFEVDDTGNIKEIVPELSTPDGRPDVTIECENHKLIIEIKIGADFTKKQIERYKNIDDSSVFLIYKFLKDPVQAQYADNTFTWYEIYSSTKIYMETLPITYPEVQKYQLKQFIRYLEETDMAIDKVSWEIINGAKSLINLGNQIAESLNRLRTQGVIKNSVKSSSSPEYTSWRVYTFEGHEFYINLNYNPVLIIITSGDIDDKFYSSFQQVRKIHPEINWQDELYIGSLDIIANNFLCLSVDSQIDMILQFIQNNKQAYIDKLS